MTLRENLERGAAQLGTGPHPERARLDAETLLLHQIGKNRAWLITHLDDDFAGCRAIGYAALLERRAKGEPIQYILGECEFYGMPFRVTPDVLIPRPETELLVEKAAQLMPVFDRGCEGFSPRVLDVGTGSGAIAISIAHDWGQAEITAVDISPAALEVARSNAERLGFADEIRFLLGDLIAPGAGEVFDLIVSNPPYVPTRDRDSLVVEVRDYEPAIALFAGDDGLGVYRRLIPAAYAALAHGGYIAFEIGYDQADAVRDLLQAANFEAIEFTPDLQGIPRLVTAQKP
jgi:release factor glutamine methyltransferase